MKADKNKRDAALRKVKLVCDKVSAAIAEDAKTNEKLKTGKDYPLSMAEHYSKKMAEVDSTRAEVHDRWVSSMALESCSKELQDSSYIQASIRSADADCQHLEKCLATYKKKFGATLHKMCEENEEGKKG